MWATGQQAAPVAYESQSRRSICGYAAYLRSRAEVRERKRDADIADYVPGTFAAIPDGIFAMAREGATWSLWLEWDAGYGRRQVASGTWEEVERCALEVTIHGPPGGPDLRGQGSKWRDIGGDGTLHSLTLGGEFRLMPLYDEGHILALSRNDGPVRVLGIGDAEPLQQAPGERRNSLRGDVLHVYIGGERTELRGVCAAGVLAILEMDGGSRLQLGHLEGDDFGLFLVHGSEGRCLGMYDFDALRRGDLGPVLDWVGRGLGERGGLDEEGDLGDARRPTQAQRLRRRLTPHQAASVQTGPRTQVATPRARQREPARAKLSPAGLQYIDDHLTATEPRPPTGGGATQISKLFEGLRELAPLDLPTQLLRGCGMQSLFKAQPKKIEFHCCTKTFGRTLASAARHTPMLKRVGKRWLLLGGAELLEAIAAFNLKASEDAQQASRAAPRGPEPPAMDPQPVATPEPPASSTMHPEPSASSTSSPQPEPPGSSPAPAPRDPEPPMSRAARPETVPASPVRAPGSPIEDPPAPAADIAGLLIQVPPPGDEEGLATLEWVLARGNRGYQHIRHHDILRVSIASVDDNVSASRYPGKKPRDGP